MTVRRRRLYHHGRGPPAESEGHSLCRCRSKGLLRSSSTVASDVVRQRGGDSLRRYLVGEIIHNPHVNARLRDMGIEILLPREGHFDFAGVKPEDVVILPAFGVTIHDFEDLRRVGCILVDTTCGSVLNVWKRVESYAKDGFTALIHGKHYHEETKATSSQVTRYPGGRYLVVRDMAEAREVCAYIEGAGSGERFLRLFAGKMSPGFDPDRDLARVGVANQTTMLSGESLAIAAELRKALAQRYGDEIG